MVESLEILLAPIVAGENCEIYTIEYLKEGASRILRIYIDKATGVTIDDCEKVSRAVSEVLDSEDIIKGEYRLQVSSPGVERVLKKPDHYKRYIGHKVEVKLYAPVSTEDGANNRKKFTGKILDFDNTSNKVIIKCSTDQGTSEVFTFDLQQISTCKLKVFEDSF